VAYSHHLVRRFGTRGKESRDEDAPVKGRPFLASLAQYRQEVASYTIPEFQRGLVWSEAQVMRLLDSAEKGFPLGMVILWVVYSPKGATTYVVDGQQRLTALTGIRPGTGEPVWDIQFDLDQRVWVNNPQMGQALAPLWATRQKEHELFDRIRNHPHMREYYFRRDHIQDCTNLQGFVLDGASPAEVADAFCRMGSGGTPIDPVTLEKALAMTAQT